MTASARRPQRLLVFDHQVAPPVLLVAALIGIQTERMLLAVRHHVQTLTLDLLIDKTPLNRPGALFAQHEVVRQRAALIAMPFDDEPLGWMPLHPVGIVEQHLSALLGDGDAIEAEKDVAEAGSLTQVATVLAEKPSLASSR